MTESVFLCFCNSGEDLLSAQFKLERDEIPYQVRKSGIENSLLGVRFFAEVNDPEKAIQIWVPADFHSLATAAITGESKAAERPLECPACGAANPARLENCPSCGLFLG